MKELIIVHGGSEYASIEDFNADLKDWSIAYGQQKLSWKDWLQQELNDHFVVFRPEMPNKLMADYSSWKIWFEKYLDVLNRDSEKVMVGHSLGGIFLLKYLSENGLDQPIDLLVMVAPVIDNQGLTGTRGKLESFLFNLENVKQIEKQAKRIVIYHSKDDQIVPFEHSKRLVSLMSKAEFVEMDGRGHFNGKDFLELRQLLNNTSEFFN